MRPSRGLQERRIPGDEGTPYNGRGCLLRRSYIHSAMHPTVEHGRGRPSVQYVPPSFCTSHSLCEAQGICAINGKCRLPRRAHTRSLLALPPQPSLRPTLYAFTPMAVNTSSLPAIRTKHLVAQAVLVQFRTAGEHRRHLAPRERAAAQAIPDALRRLPRRPIHQCGPRVGRGFEAQQTYGTATPSRFGLASR